MLHRRGEYNLGICVSEPLERSNEGIQLHGGVEGHLNQHGVFSRDTVTFQNIGTRFNEGIKLSFLFWRHFQIDIGFDVVA